MADANDIAEALADSLASLKDTQDEFGFTIYSYLPTNPNLPCLFVTDGAIMYDRTMRRGHDDWVFEIWALVPAGTTSGAQKKLRRLRASSGAESVKTLVEADRKLGGVAFGTRVTGAKRIVEYKIEGSGGTSKRVALGCEWTVTLSARGDSSPSPES